MPMVHSLRSMDDWPIAYYVVGIIFSCLVFMVWVHLTPFLFVMLILVVFWHHFIFVAVVLAYRKSNRCEHVFVYLCSFHVRIVDLG